MALGSQNSTLLSSLAQLGTTLINARIYRLQFSDARPIHLVATDSGYLESPVELEELRLSPGERAEVLVDFSNGSSVALTSQRDPNAGMGGMMGRFQDLGADLRGGEFEVLSFAVSDRAARIAKLPETLGGKRPALDTQSVSITRRMSLDMGMGGMMGSGMTINGKPFDSSTINFHVALGAMERWIVSSTMLSHPFHIHGVSFQVVKENGNPPRAENTGWKDTVLVENEVELLMRFNHAASDRNPYMYHCHILEHEDAGMMGQFTVG